MTRKLETFRQRGDFGPFDANLRFVERTGLLNRQPKILEIGSGKGRLLNHHFRKGFDIRRASSSARPASPRAGGRGQNVLGG